MNLIYKLIRLYYVFGFTEASRRVFIVTKNKLQYISTYFSHNSLKINNLSLNKRKKNIIFFIRFTDYTGSSILSLNLIKKLKKKFNIIILYENKDKNFDSFESNSNLIFKIPTNFNSFFNKILQKINICSVLYSNSLLDKYSIYFNTRKIQNIFFINEIYKNQNLDFLFTYSDKLIFPNKYTLNTFKNDNKYYLDPRKIIIKQQPVFTFKYDKKFKFIKTDKKIIAAMGTVCTRKSTDLFLKLAKLFSDEGNKDYIFIWVGDSHQTEPELWNDLQLHKERLDNFIYLKSFDDYYNLYKYIDIFLLLSREDPLPNVALEAIFKNIPVLFFKNCTGLDELLGSFPKLKNQLSVEPFSLKEMKNKIIDINNLKNKKKFIYPKKLLQKNASVDYYKFLLKIINNYENIKNDNLKINKILNNFSDLEFDNNYLLKISTLQSHYEYSLKYKIRKIYEDLIDNKFNIKKMNKYKKNYLYLSKNVKLEKNLINTLTSQTCIHLHCYYTDGLKEIINLIIKNDVRPKIFITTDNIKKFNYINSVLKKNKFLKYKIIIINNKGRDIYPMFHIKKYLLKFNFILHFHVKKSLHANNKLVSSWVDILKSNLLSINEINSLDQILLSLYQNKNIKIAFPHENSYVGITKNFNSLKNIFTNNYLSFKYLDYFLFPIGNCYLIKKDSLKKLLSLKINFDTMTNDKIDGDALHAFERLTGYLHNNPDQFQIVANKHIKNRFDEKIPNYRL